MALIGCCAATRWVDVSALLFPSRVLLQLLRVYAVLLGIGVIVAFAFYTVAGGGNVAGAAGIVGHFLSLPTFVLGGLHLATFAAFRYYVAPRFPDVSPLVTFAVAAPLGAALLGGGWTLAGFVADTAHGPIATLPSWAVAHSDWVVTMFILSSATTLVAAVVGAGLFALSRGGALNFGLARFIGGLMVGRTQYDAFAAREHERLQSEYDDYVREVRGQGHS